MSQIIITPMFFQFLRELQRHNQREWFNANKERYHHDVRDPAVELIRQIELPLRRAAPLLCAIPKPHGGSLMRIYKDTRFAADKTPYKTNVGISLRHQLAGDIHAPGVYIHLDPHECFLGAGCWRPERSVRSAIRAAIDRNPHAWKRARDNKRFRQIFQLAGEKLKTSPRDYPSDHPQIEDLRRIDFIAVAPLSIEEITSDTIVSCLMERIKAAKPLMQFLCDAIDVPY